MQIVIISGKGGTGKTTVASSLAYLSKDSIKADCDVDASNLHIILKGNDIEEKLFIGSKIGVIDPEKCVKCGRCVNVCRYNAISNFTIDELLCEGCGACRLVCKYEAITLEDDITGKTIITKTDAGILSRATMEIGAEGSGKLVTEVRENAMKHRKDDELIILDGSPGVGCAVMASITGCDIALIVTEPTQSGIEDLKRVLSLCKFFGVKSYICINKYDINENIAYEIEKYCKEEDVKVIGKIPYDDLVKKSINELRPIITYEDSRAGKEIKQIWNKLKEYEEVI